MPLTTLDIIMWVMFSPFIFFYIAIVIFSSLPMLIVIAGSIIYPIIFAFKLLKLAFKQFKKIYKRYKKHSVYIDVAENVKEIEIDTINKMGSFTFNTTEIDTINKMGSFTFNTTEESWVEYDNKTCIIVKELTMCEYEIEELGVIYKVQFEDGSIIDAFKNELTEIKK